MKCWLKINLKKDVIIWWINENNTLCRHGCDSFYLKTNSFFPRLQLIVLRRQLIFDVSAR